MTAEEYRKLLDTDFSDVKLEDMADLKELRIDRKLPLEKRREQYIRKVKNPYIVRVGKMKVKISFANNGISLEQAFEDMLLTV